MALANVELDSKGRFRIGKKLGEGAMGVVHEVVDSQGKENGWAVKFTAIPKQTKQRRSQPEVQARLLHHERQLYQVNLRSLCGSDLPSIPSGNNLHVFGKSGKRPTEILV